MKLIKWFVVLSLFTATVANAAFFGTNVSGYGNGYADNTNSSQLTLYSSNLEDDLELSSSYLYTDVATSDIKVSFNWLYQTFDEDGSFDSGPDTGYLDPAGYIVNGIKTQLNSALLSQFDSESGVSFFTVTAGRTFGFYADTYDNEAGRGALTISNFSITAVPEPESFALLLIGLGLIGFNARYKRQ